MKTPPTNPHAHTHTLCRPASVVSSQNELNNKLLLQSEEFTQADHFFPPFEEPDRWRWNYTPTCLIISISGIRSSRDGTLPQLQGTFAIIVLIEAFGSATGAHNFCLTVRTKQRAQNNSSGEEKGFGING